MADRITVLRDGRRVGTREATALPRNDLVQWMVGRRIDRQFPIRTTPSGGERLRLEHVYVSDRLRKKCFVRDVSFSIQAGEVLGIAGLQGSGNSMLLEGLFGVHGTRALSGYGILFSIFSMHWGCSPGLAIAMALLLGAGCGAVSGGLIARFHMQPFIVTLAMMVFARGLAKWFSGGQKISTAVKREDGHYHYVDVPAIIDLLNAKMRGGISPWLPYLFCIGSGLFYSACETALGPLLLRNWWK